MQLRTQTKLISEITADSKPQEGVLIAGFADSDDGPYTPPLIEPGARVSKISAAQSRKSWQGI